MPNSAPGRSRTARSRQGTWSTATRACPCPTDARKEGLDNSGGRNRTSASWFRARCRDQPRLPRIGSGRCSLNDRRAFIRGGGLEPPRPASKAGGLPLADPRVDSHHSRPGLTAEGEGVEPPRLIARPCSRRLPSPRWLALPCWFAAWPGSKCPAGLEPARPPWEGGRLPLHHGHMNWSDGLSTSRVGPEGLEPSPTRLRAGRAAANTWVPRMFRSCLIGSIGPGGVGPPSGGYRPPVLPLNYGPHGLPTAPCVSASLSIRTHQPAIVFAPIPGKRRTRS